VITPGKLACSRCGYADASVRHSCVPKLLPPYVLADARHEAAHEPGNVFPGLKAGAFRQVEDNVLPREQDISSGIDVAVTGAQRSSSPD